MVVYLCREFLRDLADHGDANFAGRVISKILNTRGDFEADADDHPYNGIDDAWIRYISRQKTAYRAIFIRRGEDIYWYRAGEHSIERNLSKPGKLDVAIPVGPAPAGVEALADYDHPRYLKSSHPRLLKEVLSSRIPLPHRSLTLVSPSITFDLTHPNEVIGRLIESVIQSGGNVTTITSPPNSKSLWLYRNLAARGVELLIHPNLNARFYIFEVAGEKLRADHERYTNAAFVGSAELTRESLNLDDASEPREELCYEVDHSDIDGAFDFLLHLTGRSQDLETHVRLDTERSLRR